MAVYRWRGEGAGTKTDWNDGRNWVDSTGAAYVVGTYPGSVDNQYDEVYFDATITNGCTTNCDRTLVGHSAAGNEDLKLLRVDAAYNNDIGSAATPLKIEITNNGTAAGCECLLDLTNAGDVYLTGASAAFGGITDLKVIGKKAGEWLKLSGNLTNVTLLKGNVDMQAAVNISGSLVVSYMESQGSDVVLNSSATPIPSGATLPAIVQVSGGVVYSDCTIATLKMTGGVMYQGAGISTLVDISGGVFYWKGMDAAVGAAGNLIADALIKAGSLDCSQGEHGRTITQCTVYPGGTLNLDNGLRNIVITNQITTLGGVITFCVGQKITLA